MHTYLATVNGKTYRIELVDEHHIRINDVLYEVDFQALEGQPLYSLLASGASYEAIVAQRTPLEWEVLLRGVLYRVQVEDERERRLREQAAQEVGSAAWVRILAPMPGLVVEVRVRPGDTVDKGDVLLILESMKMQNEIRAPRKGLVQRVHVAPGESVEQNAILVDIE